MAALDGGLQLAVLLTQRVLGGASLPTSIAELRSYRSRPAEGPIRCIATQREVGRASVTTDIVFVDSEGERVAELLGAETHLLPKTAPPTVQG